MNRWFGGTMGSAHDIGPLTGRSSTVARRSVVRMTALGVAIAAALIPASTASATGGVVTTLVSVSRSGGGGNGASVAVAVTPDGRYVLFNSSASNLVAGDTNGKSDVFVRDVVSGRTHRVDLGPNRRQANASAVGTAISANGRYVVFTSTASNLTRRPDTNHVSDVFLRNRKTGRTSAGQYPQSRRPVCNRQPGRCRVRRRPLGGLYPRRQRRCVAYGSAGSPAAHDAPSRWGARG